MRTRVEVEAIQSDVRVRLRLLIDVALWRHGWIWVVTLLTIVASGVAVLLGEVSLQRESEQLTQQRAELDAAQAEARIASSTEAAGTRDQPTGAENEDRRASLASLLLAHSDASEEVRHLYELAAAEQIVISQAEYRSDVDSEGVERLHVRMPAKATYPQLRRFAESSLRALPNASLDGITFRRNQVADPQIEAQVNFSLWLKGSSPRAVSDAASDASEAKKP